MGEKSPLFPDIPVEDSNEDAGPGMPDNIKKKYPYLDPVESKANAQLVREAGLKRSAEASAGNESLIDEDIFSAKADIPEDLQGVEAKLELEHEFKTKPSEMVTPLGLGEVEAVSQEVIASEAGLQDEKDVPTMPSARVMSEREQLKKVLHKVPEELQGVEMKLQEEGDIPTRPSEVINKMPEELISTELELQPENDSPTEQPEVVASDNLEVNEPVAVEPSPEAAVVANKAMVEDNKLFDVGEGNESDENETGVDSSLPSQEVHKDELDDMDRV